MALLAADQVTLPGRIETLSLAAHAGELLGLIGPNGAGKSSLLHALAGLLSIQGSVRLEGQDLHALHPRARARKLALLPQRAQCAWSLRVYDVVSLGRLPWGDCDDQAIRDAMRMTEVEHLSHRPMLQLSGGEQARVCLARVLAGRPSVLLADEPAAALDLVHQRRCLQALRAYAEQGNAVLMAAHDLSMAARACHRLLLLNRGRMLALGEPREVLTEELLASAYGLNITVDLQAQPPRVDVREG